MDGSKVPQTMCQTKLMSSPNVLPWKILLQHSLSEYTALQFPYFHKTQKLRNHPQTTSLSTPIIQSITIFLWFYLLNISLICPFFSLLTQSTASPGGTTAMALLSGWPTSPFSLPTLWFVFYTGVESWGSFKNTNLIFLPLLNTLT